MCTTNNKRGHFLRCKIALIVDAFQARSHYPSLPSSPHIPQFPSPLRQTHRSIARPSLGPRSMYRVPALVRFTDTVGSGYCMVARTVLATPKFGFTGPIQHSLKWLEIDLWSLLRKFHSSDECYLTINWLIVRAISRLTYWPIVVASVIESILSSGMDDEGALSAARICLDKVRS